MAAILVAYYSRSGVTERAAGDLAERLGADLDLIRPAAAYAGPGGFQRGVWHSLFGRTPPVTCSKNPAHYDVVVLGAPVWAGRPAAPLRSYMRTHGAHIPVWAAFCVSGSGRPYPKVFADMGRLLGGAPFATLALADRDVRSGAARPRLQDFAARIQAQAHPAA